MSTFIHTASDEIAIDSSRYPLAFFVTQEAAYAIPSGSISQYYDDSIPYRIASDGSSQTLLSRAVWATGDGYIANKATYDAAYVDYVSYPDVATAKLTVNGLIRDLRATKKSGGIIYGGNTYTSDSYSLIRRSLERYAKVNSDMPAGFYLRDSTDAERLLDVSDLFEMSNLIDDLDRLCEENADNHLDSVDALGVIADIKSYDYTTGWPAVPYS